MEEEEQAGYRAKDGEQGHISTCRAELTTGWARQL